MKTNHSMTKSSDQTTDRTTHRTALALAIGAVLTVSTPGFAADLDLGRSVEFFKKVKLDGYLSQGLQSVEADSGAFDPEDANMSFGFNRFRFALGFSADITDNIHAFIELSEEPNDFGNDFTPHVDLAYVNIGLNDNLTFQMGTIVTVLFNYRGYSDGAVVQGNPLIGNSPADMVTAAEGVKLIGEYGRVHWDLGVSSSDFGESFGGDRGQTYLGRASFDVSDSFGIGFGLASSDHGDQVRNGSSDIIRAGLYQGDGDNYRFRSADNGGIRNTHAGLIPGLDTTALHIDAQYKTDVMVIRAWAGHVEDDFSFADELGNPTVASQNVSFIERESEMDFYGVEGTYHIVPEQFYVALRYVTVSNESEGAGSDNELSRIQLGFGYQYADNVLFKAELVSQKEESSSAGQIGDDWNGFMLEASYTF